MNAPKPGPDPLTEIIGHLNQGLSYFDQDLRLVVCNERFRDLLGFPESLAVPGTPAEMFFRYNAERGEYGDGDVEDLVRARTELVLKFEPHSFERERPDGTVLLIEGRPAKGGGYVTTYTDVTALRQAERRLQSANEKLEERVHERTAELEAHQQKYVAQTQLLQMIMDNVPAGITLFDPELNLVMANKQVGQIADIPDRLLEPGTPFETILRFNVERGEYGPKNQEEWVRERMAAALEFKPHHIIRRRPNGRFIEIFGQPVKNGFVTMYCDITELKQAERSLKEMNEKLEEMVKQRTLEFEEHHRRMMTLIDNVPAILNIKDAEGRYLFSNRYHKNIYGLNDKNITGELPDVISDEHGKRMREIDRLVMNSGEDLRYDHRFTDHLGKEIDVMVHKAPVRGRDGEIAGIATVSMDITERKKSEDALSLSEKRLRGAIESIKEGFSLYDAEDRLIACNEKYLELWPNARNILETGGTFEDMIRSNVSEGKIVEAIGREEEFIQERLDQHRNEPSATVVREFVDGTWHRIQQIRTPDGGTALSFIDITELKRTEANLIVAKERAEQASQAKSLFLATMSHEFRTPLNAILGYSEMLRSEYFGPLGAPNYKEYSEDIYKSGQQMLALVDDILDISAIEAGKRPIVKENLILDPVLKECVSDIETQAKQKGIALKLDLPEALPSVYADKRSVIQIVQNLLSNAVKYTPGRGSVTLSAGAENGFMTIKVADTGIGIDKNSIHEVTKAFSRSHTNPHTAHEGTGLGLAIVKSLTEAQNGQLEIDSILGSGTTVWIRLPMEERGHTRR